MTYVRELPVRMSLTLDIHVIGRLKQSLAPIILQNTLSYSLYVQVQRVM
jgi:hypothetical protein